MCECGLGEYVRGEEGKQRHSLHTEWFIDLVRWNLDVHFELE